MTTPARPPPLRKLQTATPREPHHWNVEVVRALSSRVPYGRTAVTTTCEACHSVFYPCLCSKAQQQTKAVRAPRIVEMAEKLRITPGTTGMGHLHYVKTTCFTHALDRHRLLVLGQGGQQDADFSCTVVLRKGDAYVVHCDEGDDWSQELALTPSELRTVIANLRATCDPDEPTAPLTLQADVAVARIETGFYEDEASALEDFGLMSVPRASASAAEGREQPPRDLTAAASGPGQPDTEASYFVRWVKTGGPAYNAGVRPGQVLARMVCCKVVDRNRRLLEFFDPVEQLLLPFCRRPHADAVEEFVSGRAAQRAPGLEFPCGFEFDPLPSGWTAGGHRDEMGNDVEATLDSLQELCEALEDRTAAAVGQRGGFREAKATVRFIRRPILVLSRRELSVRHQHRWEAAVTQQNSQINAVDMEQLWEWGVRSRLSPSQLEFTFKKLIAALTSELQAFERERESRETTLVQNASKCAEIQMRGGSDEAVRVIEEELCALCAECPLYFLYEVRDGCNMSDEEAIRAVRRPRRSATKSGGAPDELGHSGEGGALPVRVAAKTRARLLAYLPGAPPLKVVQSAGLHRLRERDAYEQANAVFQQKTLEALGRATNSYLAALERGQQGKVPQKEVVPGRIPIKWNLLQTQYHKVEKGRKDGRLSFDEFVRVLYNAGICWLSKVEMKNRFDSMDMDRSGFLSLGEVLCASERMKELVQQLREHERELDRCGQTKHSLQDLLESFLSARGFSGQPGAKPPPGTPTCAPDWEEEKADSSAGSYEGIPGFICHVTESIAS